MAKEETVVNTSDERSKALKLAIEKIEKVRIGKVRRAKLFFLRGLSGKKARIVEDLSATSAEKNAK